MVKYVYIYCLLYILPDIIIYYIIYIYDKSTIFICQDLLVLEHIVLNSTA